jgi:uncharacterized tellurite resistance protein B-like protein
LQAAQWTTADRELAISALTNSIQADGAVTAAEQSVVAEITAALDASVSDAELRKLSTAAGLMARVSRADQAAADAELDAIAPALQSNWIISEEVAHIAAEATISGLSLDTDPLRLAREFMDITTEEERLSFMDVLFAVSVADGFVSELDWNSARSAPLPRGCMCRAKLLSMPK